MASQKKENKADLTLETRSSVSSSSSKTVSSTASSAATKARAKAEALKVKSAYAEREATMLREKARIEEQRQRTLAQAERNKADVENGAQGIAVREGGSSSIQRGRGI